MQCDIYYLWNVPGSECAEEARELSVGITVGDISIVGIPIVGIPVQEDGVTPELFEKYHRHVGTEFIEGDDVDEVLETIWHEWNATDYGTHSERFMNFVWCDECGSTFGTSERHGSYHAVSDHGYAVPDLDEVPDCINKGIRSMMVGDIVVVDGTAYLCESVGWSAIFDVPRKAMQRR